MALFRRTTARGAFLNRRRDRSGEPRPSHESGSQCGGPQKDERTIECTETTDSSSDGDFIPREIELQNSLLDNHCRPLEGGSARQTTSPLQTGPCLTSSRWDYVIAWVRSLCCFASQAWTILRSDGWSIVEGKGCRRRPWWKTEFARAVSFCLLVPLVGVQNCLPILFPILLLSGFLQSDDTVYACNVKHH